MPDDFDPYRPPVVDAPPPEPPPVWPVPTADWRPFEAYEAGETLVISREAPLPDVCMKCGGVEADMHRRLVSFTWVPPAAFFLLCCGWLGILLIMISFAKQARFYIPLCAACSARWKQGTVLVVLGIAGVLVLFYLLYFAALGTESTEGLVAAVAAIFLGAPVLLLVYRIVARPRTVWCGRIDPDTLHLCGVDPKARTAAIAMSRTYGRAPPMPGARR